MKKRIINTSIAFFGFCLISLLVSSCVTHKKLLILHEEGEVSVIDTLQERVLNKYHLQSGDVLDIKVSSLDPGSVAIFNKSSGGNSSTNITEASVYINGYMIDQFGDVNVPLIGDLKVKGLTLDSVNSLLDTKLAGYFKFFTVEVKLVNIRISILGEVKSPGKQLVYNNDINLLQAISVAGGFTDHANRRKIKVIRKAFNKNEIMVLDLSKEDIIHSEYFYLMPNDVIYVTPYKSKATAHNLPIFSLLMASASFAILIINLVTKP